MAACVEQDICGFGGLVRLEFNPMCVNLGYFLDIKWSWEIQRFAES